MQRITVTLFGRWGLRSSRDEQPQEGQHSASVITSKQSKFGRACAALDCLYFPPATLPI
jgi:hypothetical protein